MDPKDYWVKKHTKYSSEDWISKPTLFATQIVSYLPKSGTILDLGAGQGQDSKYLASLGYQVTATDLSQFALDKIVEPTIHKLQIDFSNPLPFEPASFDVVYNHLGTGYFDHSRTKDLFNEIKTILKPGGILAALFNSTDDPETQTGERIEEDYYLVDGIKKRFLSIETARDLVPSFEILLLDNQGTTYKDEAKGVHNLIRLVAKKPLT